MPSYSLAVPPTVVLRWRNRTVPARPLALRGDEACLVLDAPPPVETPIHLVLGWPCGGTTVLDARLREVALDGQTARVDVCGVTGDWEPFLRYLGERAAHEP